MSQGNLLAPMETADQTAVSVMLPMPVGPYDYWAPNGPASAPGTVVLVPLGNRQQIGVIWGPSNGDVSTEKLKPILGLLEAPPIPAVSRDFVDWVAGYTLSPPGQVLRMVVSVPDALSPPKAIALYSANPTPPKGAKPTPARRRVLDVLADGPPRPAKDIAAEAGCGVSVIKGMADLGLLSVDWAEPASGFRTPDLSIPRATLNDDQQDVADLLMAETMEGGYGVTLLDGVTGSGKTEVYFEAVAACLAAGRQALVMLPEIALSTQWLGRFEERFGTTPAAWHSGMPQSRRTKTWRAVAEGKARIIVGARSALFLPYPDLGLIVVDEEHEPAYKQEDGVSYNARDMAVVRAKLGDVPVVLATATPSVETAVNAWTGRYRHAVLAARHGGAMLPSVETIDLRVDRPDPGCFISRPLLRAINDGFARGEQAMLFLNRRGYAPLTLCRSCGHRFECPQCTAWLVEHRLTGRLTCHHCGYTAPKPAHCPSCGEADSLTPVGPGIERIAEEVDRVLPDAKWAIAASDMMHKAEDMAALVRQMEAGDINMLIGTQMLAKGHHFPGLTTVGVVDADLGFAGGDLRAAERTFQMLTQVAGRAGRGERPGRVLLQTRDPENPVMRAILANDRDGFLEVEAQSRHRSHMPPYGRLASVVVSGRDLATVEGFAAALARTAPRRLRSEVEEGDWTAEVLGPSAPPMALLRGRHRRRLLVKTSRRAPIQKLLAEWLAGHKAPSSLRVSVDIDPYSFM